ncbi:FG-GAP-like repeat-containing protein [Actinoplanes sp. NPDC020271]|uniref:FG-GAP-like repeat-containing protein n=1 Tax=Actinoplanes sp. NPDC020271 TaxID=3363896 RepID=UPI00378788C5
MTSSFVRRAAITALLSSAFLLGTVAPAHAYATAACSSAGVTAADNALATSLNPRLQGKMRNQMTGYRVSCARAVAAAVQARGLDVRAATIAMATVIVETSIENISEQVDHDSLGLFQQRASWGTAQQRLNPAWATNAFLNKMLSLYPDGSWRTRSVGEVAQAVQVSAYPSRYEPQAADGAVIAGALFGGSGGGLAAGDVTGDGYADVIGRTTDGNLLLYPNNGAGAAAPYGPNRLVGSGWQTFTTIRIADVTGDHKGDVVAVRNDGTLWLYTHGGDNNAPYSSGQLVGDGWGGFRNVSVADVTGDGKADVLGVTADGKLLLYTHGGDNSAPYSTGRQVGDGWAGFIHVTAADVTADGKADILASGSDGQLRLYAHTGDNNAPYSTGPLVGTGWAQFDRVLAADVNNDQHADLLATRPDGTLWLYANTGDNSHPYDSGAQIGIGWNGFA